MFSVYCPRHGHDVLLGHRQILGIEGSGDRLTVHWVCWCGHQGTQQSGGRPQAVTAASPTPDRDAA